MSTANITWASSTTSSNPPQTNSDTLSLFGYGNVTAAFTANAIGIDVNLHGTANLQLSPDGSTWTTLGSETFNLPEPDSGNVSIGPVSIGSSYLYARINWAPAASGNHGDFSAGTWTLTTTPLPPPPTPVPFTVGFAPGTAALLQSLSNAYGVDVLCLTDLDPNLSLTQNSLPQDIWHLITETPGTIFWAPSNTFSLLNLLSKGITQASVSPIQATIQAIVQSDERVSSAQVSVVLVGQQTLNVTIMVVPLQAQSFQLVVGISRVSITLLSAGLVGG